MSRLSRSELLKAKQIIDRFFVESGRDMTLDDLYDFVQRNYWGRMQTRWAKEAQRLYEKNIRKYLGKFKIANLSTFQVRYWHERFKDTPTTANRALAVLSKMFNYAQERGHVAPGVNPCHFVKNFPERKRKRYATRNELARIIQFLHQDFERKPREAGYLLTLMYSGARPIFLIQAKWKDLKEVEQDGQIFGVIEKEGKSSKQTGEDERVIIPPQAMVFVNKQSRLRLDGMIFGGRLPHSYWRGIVKRFGCEDLWMRDLRRTFASIAKSSGETMDVIGDLLNHKCQETTKIYAKLLDEKRFFAVSNIASQIDSVGVLALTPDQSLP